MGAEFPKRSFRASRGNTHRADGVLAKVSIWCCEACPDRLTASGRGPRVSPDLQLGSSGCTFAAPTGFAPSRGQSAARRGRRSVGRNSVLPGGRRQALMPFQWFPGFARHWPRAMAQAIILGSIAFIGIRCRRSANVGVVARSVAIRRQCQTRNGSEGQMETVEVEPGGAAEATVRCRLHGGLPPPWDGFDESGGKSPQCGVGRGDGHSTARGPSPRARASVVGQSPLLRAWR